MQRRRRNPQPINIPEEPDEFELSRRRPSRKTVQNKARKKKTRIKPRTIAVAAVVILWAIGTFSSTPDASTSSTENQSVFYTQIIDSTPTFALSQLLPRIFTTTPKFALFTTALELPFLATFRSSVLHMLHVRMKPSRTGISTMFPRATTTGA